MRAKFTMATEGWLTIQTIMWDFNSVPVSVRDVILVPDPGLLSEIVRLDVPTLASVELVCPPYSVPEARVIVFTFEPKRPKV